MLSALIFGLAISPASANLITNGSFETPVVPAGGFTNFNTGSTGITGWTVVGPQVSIVSGSSTENGSSFPAESGTQWLDLTGDTGDSDAEGVSQTVATLAGTSYSLSYYVGNVINSAGGFGTTSTVDVDVNGVPFQASTNSGGGTTLTWEQFQTSFVATSASTAIAFLNGDPSYDNSNGLDNVVFTAGPRVAPEPGMLPLFMVGFSCVGVVLVRRRRLLKRTRK